MTIYCHDLVCNVLLQGRPRDPVMVALFREVTFLVCKFKFEPIILKIESENPAIADYLSRNNDKTKTNIYLKDI